MKTSRQVTNPKTTKTMDERNIIIQGERAKYIVTSTNPNFDMETGDFYVEIIYGMMGKKITIQKNEFLYAPGGEWVMSFDTSDMVGPIKARMVQVLNDTDIEPSHVRPEVDLQIIGFVVTTPCPQFLKCPCNSGTHVVKYVRTLEPDIAPMYMRLCVTEYYPSGEPYYRPLITRHDEYLYVHRSVETETE